MTDQLYKELLGPHGYSAALEDVGTSAAPLLAGFALTLTTLTIANRHDFGEPDAALLLLVLAALLLVTAVQFAFRARQCHVPPGDHLSILTLAANAGVPAWKVTDDHERWAREHKKWAAWTRHAYNTGIFFLLVALAVTLIPRAGVGHMPPFRVAAFLLAIAGAGAEALWTLCSE
jgi:hypothetical protein